MPDAPPPRPAEPTPPDYYEQFLVHLEAIEAHTRLMESYTRALPDVAEKMAAVADVYSKAGPSRPVPGAAVDMGPSEGASVGRRTLTDQERQLRRALTPAGGGRRLPVQTFSEPDYDEAETGVYGMEPGITGTSASSGASQSWLERVTPGGSVFGLPRMQGAQLTPADKLSYIASVAANFGNRKRQGIQRKLDALKQDPDKLWDDPNLDPEDRVLTPAAQGLVAQLNEGTQGGGLMGQASDFLHTAAGAYSQGKYISDTVRSIIKPFQSMRTLGYQTGFEGGSPGFMGLRAPWDPAVLAGIRQKTGQFDFALHNQVTPGQANTIWQGLYGQGWYSGQQANDMRTAAAQMMHQNPFIGSMPQYYEMMDKSTRLGAASLEHFNDVMMSVPKTALAAHVSIAQTISDMDQLGQANKAAGGTYIGGLENAQAWQRITGTPASVMGTLMQNPMVTGQTFRQTGLLPWEQGLASPYQHMSGIMGALNLYGGAIRTPGDKTFKDAAGYSQVISGQDQKEALMAHFLGVSKEYVHTMLANQKGWQAGMQIGQTGQDIQDTVLRDLRGNNLGAAYSDLTDRRWQSVQKQLSGATDAQGHKIFEDWNTYDKLRKGGVGGPGLSPALAHAYAQNKARQDIAQAGTGDIRNRLYKDLGLTPLDPGGQTISHMSLQQLLASAQQAEKKGKLTPAQYKDIMATVAKDRNKKIQDYQNMNQNKFGPGGQNPSGPKLTIELGAAAKKMFHLTDPNSQQKANQNAGATDVNTNSWAGGPSASPTPNLDTAGGGGGTYNYGSQYDTGSY